jgi:hypothetical protein
MLPNGFRLDAWGMPTANHGHIKRVMFKACEGGGFFMITEEPGGVFDVWLETSEEVVLEMNLLKVSWE